jgi:hypothetical protein
VAQKNRFLRNAIPEPIFKYRSKSAAPFPASEANDGSQSPGLERCSRSYDGFIMMTETAPHIVRETYIVAFWLRDRDNNVNKMHGRISMVVMQTLHYSVM